MTWFPMFFQIMDRLLTCSLDTDFVTDLNILTLVLMQCHPTYN